MFQTEFEVFLFIVGGGEFMTIENPSLSAHPGIDAQDINQNMLSSTLCDAL